MAIGDKGEVGWQLRAAFDVGSIRDLTDGQLLERFATGRPEARELTFTALVERHGPMVLRVCRGVLGVRHDAEDAFQATFLVLVRRAHSLRVRDSIGPWLHQVAFRTALAARKATMRRGRLDRLAVPSIPIHEPADDLARVVQEEVARLSDRDRAVVVLCDLEGQTHEQAARALGCPIGTVKSRLARARDRLRHRLARRGLAPDLAVMAGPAPAVASPRDRMTTVAAPLFMAGRNRLVSALALDLAQGVLKTMTLSRSIRSMSITLVGGLAVAAGSSWLAMAQAPPAPAPPREPAAPPARPEVPTVVARAVTRPSQRNESFWVMPPEGIDVDKKTSRPLVPTSVAAVGARVKKGDLLFRFDPAPLRDDLARREAEAKAAEARWKEAEAAEFAAKARLDDRNKAFEARRIEARDAVIEGGRAAVARAEARVKRYQDANDRVAKMAIAPDDPTTASQLVARLELLDRLEDAEERLAREQAQLLKLKAEASEAKLGDDPALAGLTVAHAETISKREDARGALIQAREQERMVREMLPHCEVRSPADGIVAAAFPTAEFDAFTPAVGAAIEGARPLCRILTGAEPFQTLRILANGPNGTYDYKIAYVAAGQELIVGIGEEARPGRPAWRTMPATLVEPVRTDRQECVIRLDGPLESIPSNLTLEFTANVPTGSVRVPGKAVDGDQVAVRRPDGSFHWRTVVFHAQDDEGYIIDKMLVEGEVIALDPVAAMGGKPRPKAAINPILPAPTAPSQILPAPGEFAIPPEPTAPAISPPGFPT